VQCTPPTCGQTTDAHTAPGLLLQSTSQLHELEQSIDGHALTPVHWIVHLPGPQVMDGHAPALEQLMSHSYPAGHCTLPQLWLPVQSIWQVLSTTSHDVQAAGHGSGTQYPLSQVRPSLHWPSLPHA
jgi:hypothetical protein